MKIGSAVLCSFIVVGALVVTIWLGRFGGGMTVDDLPDLTNTSGLPKAPEVSKSGPQPKVVVEETEFNFGKMAVGEQKSHVFTIRNEGKGPLKLVKGESTCKCTIGELDSNGLPPGGETTITVTWTPREVARIFEQSASVMTNDLENREIAFRISGEVLEAYTFTPPLPWDMGVLSGREPSVVTGMLHSWTTDAFDITKIKSENELLSATATPLDEEKLKELGSKSGYSIAITLKPGVPFGNFSGEISMHIDLSDEATADVGVHVFGNRPSPILIRQPRGVNWYPERMFLDLGRISAKEGRKVSLAMFVAGLGDQEMKLLKVETSPDFVEISLKRDEKFQAEDRQKYQLVIEIPAGNPPGTFVRRGLGKIKLTTNHPDAKEITLKLGFISF